MKYRIAFIDFVLKEWLLVVSVVGFVLTSFYVKHFPSYSDNEIQVLFILFVLFITVNGLQKSGFILKIAQSLEKGKVIPLKLVVATFFLSMLVTNDIALVIIVPLTLSLNISKKDILIILEALAANAGSALTPVGNPQNLYIYWLYGINPVTFIKTIAPFSLVLFGLLIVLSLFLKTTSDFNESVVQKVSNKVYVYVVLLVIVLLTIFHILPILTSVVVILFALVFDRQTLRIDYALLVTFLLFFGIADNLKIILLSGISQVEHVFLFSVLASQVMSNVPATLLFAKFTSNWQALLWGVNTGGFGSLFGSLANLIAYKIYVMHEGTKNTKRFTVRFLAINYTALFVSIALYFILY